MHILKYNRFEEMHACPLQLEKERHPKMISWYNEIIDSKTVLPSSNTTDPRVSLLLSKDLDCYKLYIADTGLFITLMFMDRPAAENEIYAKLLSENHRIPYLSRLSIKM